MTTPKQIRDQIIQDAQSGMTIEQIAEKYDTSLNVVRKWAKGHFANKVPKAREKYVPKKRYFGGLKNLGMDYVELRKK